MAGQNSSTAKLLGHVPLTSQVCEFFYYEEYITCNTKKEYNEAEIQERRAVRMTNMKKNEQPKSIHN